MADETPDTPTAEKKPTPRRRGPNKPKQDGAPIRLVVPISYSLPPR